MTPPDVALVVAYAVNRVIGRDGGMPWHLPADLRHFREQTSGCAVVMGRRTWASLPERFRPLPDRRNLVLSRSPGFAALGGEVAGSLEEALERVGDEVPARVIGGEAVYAAALPLAARVLATELEAEVEGDAFFPPLPDGFAEVARSRPIQEGGHRFTFVEYRRGL